MLALVFTCIFAMPARSFPLRQATRKVVQQLGKLVELNVHYVKTTGSFATFLDGIRGNSYEHHTLTDYGIHTVQRLSESGMLVKDAVWNNILPTAGGMVANQSQLFCQSLGYYLSDEGKVHIAEIHRLSELDSPEADDNLFH